ncbi:MFS transporter [Aquihabitans sp. McL0605]|uniref:MFS transporter n=1 Tax=Aquihabitans sp. McL0605 TaxID=3415671 RepID=UPI003CE7CDC5
MTDPFAPKTGNRPGTPEGSRAFIVRPFQRLARTHVANCMADAMLAAALADSLFFSLPADSARSPVVRYLIITMLPFAVIAPLVGPLIDRLKGGHRFVLVGSTVLRIVLCYLMIGEIRAGGASFFLLALCVLVCQRAYNVARSALVPTVVASDDELIEANSKLAIIGGVSAFVGIVPAAVLLKVWGPGWALGLAMVTYGTSSVLGLRIPRSRVAVAKPDSAEKSELRGAGIRLAGAAMSLLRMCVGFLTMLVAFDFRGGDRATWEFAVVAGVSVAAQLVGAAVAPRLKAMASEETILTGSLGLVVVGTFLALFINEVLGACIVGMSVGFAAALGKLAFDSILQRDAPDANRGRSFARFETRFQVWFVAGSFIPVAIKTGARAGFIILFIVAIVATASYVIGRMAWAHRTGERQTAATAAAVGIEERFAEVSGEVKGRLAAAPRSVLSRLRGSGSGSDHDGDPTEVVDRGAVDGPHDEVDPDATPVPFAEAHTEPFDQDLAPTSPVAWRPENGTEPLPTEYPWAARPEDPTVPHDDRQG